MASIDNKVVSISFDNATFEKNVAQTMRTLGALKASLDLKGAGAGLDDISAAAGKFSLAGIGSAVDNISSKFSAMGAIAFSVLNNITSRAVDMGINLGKSFTVQPITDGFAEYELKMGSIQTIMAGSGESLEVVNQKLNDLNTYSDKTIYSFKDMTSNIGKFTNAGLDLDTSVASIQGVANVAAISGANAEEASRAMYNFAQALSSGSVKLIDWKSIENANMATAQFKTELLESAVAAGTLTKDAEGLYMTLEGTPVSATRGFNESLTEQWLTTETLNATLGRYSDETTEIGKAAFAAATDVKTFSQMMDTLKEAAGSGWAMTSEIIFGDFEEGKKLWTGLNDVVSGMIGNSADARNAMFSSWKALGGRDLLINAISTAFRNLSAIMKPISEAFREVFPAKTGKDLFDFTLTLYNLAKALKPSEKVVGQLKNVFLGVFSAIKIVIEVVKGVISVFTGLFSIFAGGAGGGVLAFFSTVGAGVNELRKALVDDGGIATFFDKITVSLASFVKLLRSAVAFFVEGFTGVDGIMEVHSKRLGGIREIAYQVGKTFSNAVNSVKEFVNGLDFSGPADAFNKLKDAVVGLFDKDLSVPKQIGQTFEALGGVFKSVGRFIQSALDGIGSFGKGISKAAGPVGKFVGQVQDEIANLTSAIGDGLSSGNFDNVLKVLQTGLFGGLLLLIKKFMKDGLKLDFGQFGMFNELEKSLGAVTGGLQAMQNNIKADTLMKIAIALGVLTLSMLALSLVDGDDLAKALAAMTVGFIQLTAVMVVLEKLSSGPMAAAKLVLLAVGLTVLAGAMFLLGLSAKLMATMGWGEMAKGLLGVLGLLILMSSAVERLSGNTDGMIRAGIAIFAIGGGLLILGMAVKLMASMGWMDMIQGLIGISVALKVLSDAMAKMPQDGMIKAAIAVGILGFSLMIMAGAIKLFAMMDLFETAEGLLGIAVALGMLVKALDYVKNDKVLETGAAILLVSIAMIFMAKAVENMSKIPFPQMIKGMIGFGITLGVLALAMKAAKTSLKGGIALFIVARALKELADVLSFVGRLPFSVIVQGLVVMGAAIYGLTVVVNSISAFIPIIAGFGGALALVGLGAALFGAAVYLIARGVAILAKEGPEGVKVFLSVLDDILAALPKMAVAFGEAAFLFVTSFLTGFDELIPMVVGLIGQLLDAIVTIVPQFIETAVTIVTAFLEGIREIYPELVATGVSLILSLLQGIRENIGQITSTAMGIVTEFINAMADGIPDYVRAMVNLFTTILETTVFELGLLMTTLVPGLGISFMDGFLTGLSDTVEKVKTFFTTWVSDVIGWVKSGFGIFSPSRVMSELGVNVILGFLKGILDTIGQVSRFFVNLAGSVLRWIGNLLGTLVSKGTDIISGLFTGITNKAVSVFGWFTSLPFKIIGAIGGVLSTLVEKGKNIIQGLLNGVIEKWPVVWLWFQNLLSLVGNALGNTVLWLYEKGKDIIRGLWDGIFAMKDWIVGKMGEVAGWVTKPIDAILGIFSPSRAFMQKGEYIGEGLILGLDSMKSPIEKASHNMGLSVSDGFNPDLTSPLTAAIRDMVDNLGDVDEFNPTITPVLDLTGVQRDAKTLNGLFGNQNTYGQAALIAASVNSLGRSDSPQESGLTEVKFEQHNYSPKALSTNDIYRNTRNQIALAKEELNIP